MDKINWATSSVQAAYQALASSEKGLSADEVQQRLTKYGQNVINTTKKESIIKTFLLNFTSLMALLLWVSGFIALFAGMLELGIAIWLVNVINGLFSFWQQYRASQATSALQKMLPNYARVLCNGKVENTLVENIVPGDVVQIKSGDNIPADGRLLQADSMQVNQSSLTGESTTVNKDSATLTADEVKAAGRFAEANLVYEGTSVVSGSGLMLVTQTGMKTEFGQIASLTDSVDATPSPLEKELNVLTKQLSLIAIVIGVIFFLAAVFFVKYPVVESFIFALGMMVALIPEGLLPTVTLSLALAVQTMAKKMLSLNI